MSLLVPLWFLFLIAMAVLFEMQTHWISRFSVFSVLLFGLFVRYGVAVPFSDTVNASVTGIPIGQGQLINYYIALTLTYLGILGGAWLTTRVGTRWTPVRVTAPWHVDPRALFLIGGGILALVVLVWILLPWQSFSSGLAQFTSRHTQIDYRGHRVAYGSYTLYANSLLTYLGSFARFALMPAVLWILFFHGRGSLRGRALFAVALVVLAAIALASGQKTPLLLLAVGYIVAQLVDSGWRRLLNWKLLAAAVVIVIAVPILYKVQYPAASLRQAVSAGLFRSTEEYSRVAQLRFIFYPDRHPYLHGFSSFVVRTAAHLVGISTGDAVSPETYIPNKVLGPQYQGTWNAGFFADAWADFGFAGVVVTALLAGILLALIAKWYALSPKGPAEKGTYTALCLAALFLTEVAFTTTLWTYGLLTSFLVYLAVRAFPQRTHVPIPAPPARTEVGAG
jgi:hypothetical protein